MKTLFYLQENRPRVIATNTHCFYTGIVVALWYKKVLKRKKKLVLKFYPKRTIIQKLIMLLIPPGNYVLSLLMHASIIAWCNVHIC